jgi:hypothetical protein
VSLHDSVDTLPVKPCDEMRNGITTPPASGASSRFVTGAIGDREEFRGACDPRCWMGS